MKKLRPLAFILKRMGYLSRKDVNTVLENFSQAVTLFYTALEQLLDVRNYDGPAKEEVSLFMKDRVVKLKELQKKLETIYRTRA